MSEPDITRDLYILKGEMRSEIKSMRDRVEKLERAVEKGMDDINKSLAALQAIENERKGSNRVWVLIAGVCGSLLTILGEFSLGRLGI